MSDRRDLFAAAALQGVLAHPLTGTDLKLTGDALCKAVAEVAVRYADALVAALGGEKKRRRVGAWVRMEGGPGFVRYGEMLSVASVVPAAVDGTGGWEWRIRGGRGPFPDGTAPTCEVAQDAADEALRTAGWELD